MGQTQIYKLGYLTPFLKTEEVLDMDERRFRAIENQTYALYTLFGNGVIDDDPANPSWHIQDKPGDTTGTVAQITSGKGHVGWTAAFTLQTKDVDLTIPPGISLSQPLLFYIYAVKKETTPDTGDVDFIASTTTIDDDDYVCLGGIEAKSTTNGGISLTPYNDAEHGRVNISLFGALANIVNKHKHIGGATNPSPINLSKHVQGKLSGDNISNLDLSAVTKGILAPERLPTIDHDNLSRNGTLTHPQIDSLLAELHKEISQDGNRLSDLTTVNTLKVALALKKQGTDLAALLDDYLVNMFLFVPGVTPDAYMAHYDPLNQPQFGYEINAPYVPDDVNLAVIDKTNQRIVSNVSTSATGNQLSWVTTYDFDKIIDDSVNTSQPLIVGAEGEGVKRYVTINITPTTTVFTMTDGTDHGFANNDIVSLTGDDLPEEFQLDTPYYVKQVVGDTTSFTLLAKRDGDTIIATGGPTITGIQVSKYPYGYISLIQPLNYQKLATEELTPWKQAYNFQDDSTFTDSDPTDSSDKDTFTDGFELQRFIYYTFDTSKDLSNVDTIGIGYGLDTEDQPGTIYAFFILDSGGTSRSLIASDGTTVKLNTSALSAIHNNGTPSIAQAYTKLLLSTFDLPADQLSKIKGIGFMYYSPEWDKNSINFKLVEPTTLLTDIDLIQARSSDGSTIFVWNESLYSNEGTAIFRVNSGYNNTVYDSLVYNIDGDATKVSVKTRTAATEEELATATIYTVSNGTIHKDTENNRTFIDIIIKLNCSIDRLSAPKISDISLKFSGPGAAQSPKIWNTGKDWNEGTIQNLAVQGAVFNEEWQSVQLATTIDDIDIVLSGYNVVVDKTTVKVGNRVLVKNQTNQAANGIYIVSSGSWQRSTDADAATDFSTGKFVRVLNGASNKNLAFALTTTAEIVLGTTQLTFEEYSNSLILVNTSNIGRYVYARGNNVYASIDSGESSFTESNYISGLSLYSSPVQVFNNSSTQGFTNPRDLEILPNGNLLVADSDNDRVVEIDNNGKLIKALQGNIRLNKIDRDFVALTAMYNPRLGKMWIAFSQNIVLADKTKMNIKSGQAAIAFSKVDPNNASNAINVIPFSPINGASATLEVTFPEVFKQQINSWTGTIQLIIENGAVQCAGSVSEVISASLNSVEIKAEPMIMTEALPDYMTGKYRNVGLYNGTLTTNGGLPSEDESQTGIEGDFNDDGEITNDENAALLGQNSVQGRITLNVTIGEIVYDNIYCPMSCQYVNSGWLIACAEIHTAMFYNNYLIRNWYIPSTIVALRENAYGSAYQLSNGYVLLAAPADEDSSDGLVLIVDKDAGTTANPNYSIILNKTVNGDAVCAIPYTNQNQFVVAVYDRLGKGKASCIILIDYSGSKIWEWGKGTIYEPTGLKLLPNGDLLISE